MEILLSSLQEFWSTFSFSKLIMVLIVIFVVVGAIDKIRGNRHGYGEQFDKGFQALGDLAAAMIGMIALVPVIEIVLGNILGAFFRAIGSDPSLFAGILLGMDLGGYPLAMELSGSEALGSFTGMIVASVMGINIVFNIPVGMGIIRKEDQPYLATGILLGFITIPVACFAGGIMMMCSGFELTFLDILFNTIPVAVVAVLIILGLLLAQQKMLKGFILFGKGVTALVTIGTMLAVFQHLTGLRLPLFHVMVEPNAEGVIPLMDAIQTVGGISLVLLGAFPLVTFITRKFRRPLQKLGARMSLDDASITGLIANLANNILAFQLMKDMSPKGKILNCAFTVSAAFLLGDHLAFTANADQQMIVPVLVAKLAGGVSALLLASLLWKKMLPDSGISATSD